MLNGCAFAKHSYQWLAVVSKGRQLLATVLSVIYNSRQTWMYPV